MVSSATTNKGKNVQKNVLNMTVTKNELKTFDFRRTTNGDDVSIAASVRHIWSQRIDISHTQRARTRLCCSPFYSRIYLVLTDFIVTIYWIQIKSKPNPNSQHNIAMKSQTIESSHSEWC